MISTVLVDYERGREMEGVGVNIGRGREIEDIGRGREMEVGVGK